MNKVLNWCRNEVVLCVAILLAIGSSFLVYPDGNYIEYIDFRTLAILFSLMTVMAGLRAQGVFDRLGYLLLSATRNMFQVVLTLVFLCFFFSMLITNDVALITFVPFTFVVLGMMGPEAVRRWTLPVVCMQTIAANLGSMLTPIGNPQNLYLYSLSDMSLADFVVPMLPYTLAALVILVGWAYYLCRKDTARVQLSGSLRLESKTEFNWPIIGMYCSLFAVCLLVVMHLLNFVMAFGIVLVAALAFDRKTIGKVDYSLLLTFVAFFIFIGNLGRIPMFSDWIQSLLSGHVVLVSVLASQVTSNVPAALMLSGFTHNTSALIIGTNLGGLGTLIASMASLISYRQITQNLPTKKGEYFRLFTVSNIAFLVVLMGLWKFL